MLTPPLCCRFFLSACFSIRAAAAKHIILFPPLVAFFLLFRSISSSFLYRLDFAFSPSVLAAPGPALVCLPFVTSSVNTMYNSYMHYFVIEPHFYNDLNCAQS